MPTLPRGERVATVALDQRDKLRLPTIDGAHVWNLEDETICSPARSVDNNPFTTLSC